MKSNFQVGLNICSTKYIINYILYFIYYFKFIKYNNYSEKLANYHDS